MTQLRASRLSTARRVGRVNFNSPAALLEFLGVPETEYRGGASQFWSRNLGNIDIILYEARQAYERRIKVLHPDLPANRGNEAECATLNAAWDRFQELVDKKKNPHKYLPAMKPLVGGQTVRAICEECEQPFSAKRGEGRARDYVKYCSYTCKTKFHIRREKYWRWSWCI